MQTSVLEDNLVAVRGMVEEHGFVSSFANTEAAGIEAGLFVVRDATETESTRLPAATGEVTGVLMLGVSMWLPGRPPQDPEYAELDMVSVLRRGRIWVVAETAMALTDNVFVRFSGGSEGRIRDDVDGGDAVALPNARVVSETSGIDELCLIEVNLP